MLRHILIGFLVLVFLFLGFGRETLITPMIGGMLQAIFDTAAFLQHGTAQRPLQMLLGFIDTLLFALLYGSVLLALILLVYPQKVYRKWAIYVVFAYNLACVGSVLITKLFPSPTTMRLSKDLQYAYFSPMPLVLLAGLLLLNNSQKK
jgi:hypothetical protein